MYCERIYESGEMNRFAGIHEVPLETDCVNESIRKGVRKPILISFSLDKPIRFILNKFIKLEHNKKQIGLSFLKEHFAWRILRIRKPTLMVEVKLSCIVH